MRSICVLLLLLSAGRAAAAEPPDAPVGKPLVRAITVFVDLDAARYAQQVEASIKQLHEAQALFEQAGFTVQTVRITTQPFMRYAGSLPREQALALLRQLGHIGHQGNMMMNIGPAVLDDQPDPRALDLLEAVQSGPEAPNASMHIAGEDGIHWHTVRAAAHHIVRVAARSPRGEGTFAFAATAMLGPGGPFNPGSWHEGQGGRFSVGLESSSVVAAVFAKSPGDAPRALGELRAALGVYAQQVERIARDIEARTGLKYWGFDPTPAPEKGDSIGAAIEAFSGAKLGSPGTLTAAYVITEAQKQLPGPRVGYAGLMLPVMEDEVIAQRWTERTISLDSLLSYSSVCGTGLDTVPLPGDVTEAQVARIVGDVAVLAYKWKKPLTARLQPAPGRKAGQMSNFTDPLLVNARLWAIQ
jgi:hypothetical protein